MRSTKRLTTRVKCRVHCELCLQRYVTVCFDTQLETDTMFLQASGHRMELIIIVLIAVEVVFVSLRLRVRQSIRHLC